MDTQQTPPPSSTTADTAPAAATVTAQPPAASRSRKPMIFAALALACAIAVGGRLWYQSEHYVETDNAYVSGHVHPISARVAGVVTRVAFEENQSVKAGTVLVELDTADQLAVIDKLKAQVSQIDAQIAQADAAVAQTRALAASSNATVLLAQANLDRASRDAERAQGLFTQQLRAISKQELDGYQTTKDAAQADVAAKRAASIASNEQIAAAIASKNAAIAQRKTLEAQIKEAQLQLTYTHIDAPIDGRIGKLTAEVGQRVQPGQQLMAVVQPGVWITANFKETQLTHMQPGQAVEISIDGAPGKSVRGRVESFSPASGAQFSLLPPDNATGNFTKIVQRVPVRIALEAADAEALQNRLIPGLSATVVVDIKSDPQPNLSAARAASNRVAVTGNRTE